MMKNWNNYFGLKLQVGLLTAVFMMCFCVSFAFSQEIEENDENEEALIMGTLRELPAWLQTPDGYRYSSKGKPDPFRPFVRPASPILPVERGFIPDVPSRPLTPLEQVEANALRPVGIMWLQGQQNNAIAMVEMPDGKGYVLRIGMPVGRYGGVVRQITSEEIIIEERGRDYMGQTVTRSVVLTLHPSRGDER